MKPTRAVYIFHFGTYPANEPAKNPPTPLRTNLIPTIKVNREQCHGARISGRSIYAPTLALGESLADSPRPGIVLGGALLIHFTMRQHRS